MPTRMGAAQSAPQPARPLHGAEPSGSFRGAQELSRRIGHDSEEKGEGQDDYGELALRGEAGDIGAGRAGEIQGDAQGDRGGGGAAGGGWGRGGGGGGGGGGRCGGGAGRRPPRLSTTRT